MVYYIAQEYGELYDLSQDPHKLENLWNDKEYQWVKEEFKSDLLDWPAKSNDLNSAYKHSRNLAAKVRRPNEHGYGLRLHGQPKP